MSADSDLIKLYSSRILALAADMPRTTRLSAPDATARKRSPLCGSTVTVDLTVSGKTITDYGQEVRACALGQAAASVVGRVIVGLTADQVRQGRADLAAMLKGGLPPAAPFDGLSVLEPAREYRNRHASIMLSLDAAVEALDLITAKEKTAAHPG